MLGAAQVLVSGELEPGRPYACEAVRAGPHCATCTGALQPKLLVSRQLTGQASSACSRSGTAPEVTYHRLGSVSTLRSLEATARQEQDLQAALESG